MAGRRILATKSGISTGTAAKTVLQVKAISACLKLLKWGIAFKGVSNTDAPILVELVRQTSGGTMTSLTMQKLDNGLTYTILGTAQHTATVEPTDSGAIIATFYVHPQTGVIEPISDNGERIIDAGTWLGLRVTATVDVNCAASIECEE